MTRTFLASCLLVVATSVPALAFQPAPTPEPATMLLVGGGLAAVILIARKRRQK